MSEDILYRDPMYLTERCKGKLGVMLSSLTAQRIYVVITETLRTYERQEFLYKTGRSRSMESYHLSVKDADDRNTDEARAFDVVLVRIYERAKVTEVQWRVDDVRWKHVGAAGELAGLVWGGRWTSFPDLCHFQDSEG